MARIRYSIIVPIANSFYKDADLAVDFEIKN